MWFQCSHPLKVSTDITPMGSQRSIQVGRSIEGGREASTPLRDPSVSQGEPEIVVVPNVTCHGQQECELVGDDNHSGDVTVSYKGDYRHVQ
jgi:hypothetical protein